MRYLGNLRKEKGMNFFFRHWKGFGWGLTSIFIVLLVVGIILLIVSILSKAIELTKLMNNIQQAPSDPQFLDLSAYHNGFSYRLFEIVVGGDVGSGGGELVPPGGDIGTETPPEMPITMDQGKQLLSLTREVLKNLDSSIALIQASIIGIFVSRIIANSGLMVRAYLDNKLSVVSSKTILITRFAFLSVIILFIILSVAFLESGINSFLSIYDDAKVPVNTALTGIELAIKNNDPTELQKAFKGLKDDFSNMFNEFSFDTIMSKVKLLIVGFSMVAVWGIVDSAYGITTKVMFATKGIKGN